MNNIGLYNILKRVKGVSDAEAKEVAANVASVQEVATKVDLAELKEALTWRIVLAISIAAGVTSAIVKLL